jgi:hypothetical protein
MRALNAAPLKPTEAQRRYLARGLAQAGGKLPLFDEHGREYDARTIRACIRAGWAEPWFANPMKPDWLVCKLTDAGRAALAD